MSLYDKPLTVEKFRKFYKNVRKNDGKMGKEVRAIHFNLNNACNFKCDFCYTDSPSGKHNKEQLDWETISNFADQAHELGYYEFDLQGGELLLRPDVLYKLMETIKTERFFTIMTTNGYLLTDEIAQKLSELGMDRLSVSITGLDAKQHDHFMNKEGAHEGALKALELAKKYGMLPVPTIAVGHYNAQSKELEDFCEWSKERGYLTHFNLAMPSGNWQGNDEIMIDEADRKRIDQLRKKYDNIIYDMWNPFDKDKEVLLGCNCVNRLYITPTGDVFPCPFLHIKIGNIKEQSLNEIVDYGFSIKHFGEYQGKCLCGEDRVFIETFCKPGMSVFNPLDAKSIFNEEDYNK